MSIYRPYIGKRKAVEEVSKDLSPGVRELVKELVGEDLKRSYGSRYECIVAKKGKK